ncbi:hypothetical protein UFOVP1351_10 [uncultured Caudovirales phage]|uniref:Uncharacterized protein n=1 Tax=uncultured Caudovirales phage TaxID=2100421 RepID=A0A6J5S0L6_9CAUD|nr:hypothetical protein UFOVP1351_10 [uncultured Caudovirales phage]
MIPAGLTLIEHKGIVVGFEGSYWLMQEYILRLAFEAGL